MRRASPAAFVLVAAFVVAAGALTFLALRIAGAERNAAEQEVRRRLRGAVESEARHLAMLVAQYQTSALSDDSAIVVKDGVFVAPAPPRPLLHLGDSGGSDRVGDSMLAEAERLEADPARSADAESIYRRLAAPANEAGTATLADRKLATWRLAALLQRSGRQDAATAERATFLGLLQGAERATVEGLLARLATNPRSAAESETLRRDLMERVGGGDDEIVAGMVREAAVADELELATRSAEVALVARVTPLLPELARRPAGAACDRDGRLMVWTRAEDGSQRIVQCDPARIVEMAAPSSRDEPAQVNTGIDPRIAIPIAAWSPEKASRGWFANLIREELDVSGLVPGMFVVAGAPQSDVDAETERRVRWIGGAMAALLLIGGGTLYWTLRAARREREAAQARAAFVARVSHDLRTPLSVIRMYAETIAAGRATEPAQVREFAGVAAREAERLTALVGQILDFSRATMEASAAANEPIDLGALLAEVVDELRGAARSAGMELALAVNGNDLHVCGDRAGLKAALVNLVTNALLHATSGGRAEIEAHAAAGVVEVRVSDRGPGLPRGLGERIFEPFVRGPEARPGGSGLGLALVREVAAKHGGRARAEDRVGGGATFVFALPRDGTLALPRGGKSTTSTSEPPS